MKVVGKCALFIVLTGILAFGGVDSSAIALSGHSDCRAIIANALPSIGDVFDIGHINPNNVYHTAKYSDDPLSIPSVFDGFSVTDWDKIAIREDSRVTPKADGRPVGAQVDPIAIRGRFDGLENSLTALYIQKDRQQQQLGTQPGFISGFFLENRDNPYSSWFFIEPIRPLLLAVERRSMEMRSDFTKVIDSCFPVESHPHIVYEAGRDSLTRTSRTRLHQQQPPQALDFSLDLEPASQVKPIISNFDPPFSHPPGSFTVSVDVSNRTLPQLQPTDPLHAEIEFLVNGDQVEMRSLQLSRNATKTVQFTFALQEQGTHILEVKGPGNAMKRAVEITPVATQHQETPAELEEPQFRAIPLIAVADSKFYSLYRNIQEKAWWEAQEEVLNLVDTFYSEQFPGLRLKIAALNAWSIGSSGPGSTLSRAGRPKANAYTLLCDFVQDGEPPGGYDADDHHDMSAENKPMLAHLFSGHAPESINDEKALGDSASLCDTTCSRIDDVIIGLAENIGGFKNPTENSCGALDEVDEIMPAGHHALSYQAPLRTISQTTTGFQATLYQRFLLTAHEIGHNLGANHSPDVPRSIMNPQLTDGIQFKFDTWKQENKKEIKSCWKHRCHKR